MPKSNKQGKDVALDWYLELRPTTVVDIGPGEGTYSKLMRPHHRGRWVGVEAWGPYVQQFNLATHYDTIVVSDVIWVNPSVFDADLVIAGDVLEHMTADQATVVVKRIQSNANNLFVSIPVLHKHQGSWQGNPFETHRDQWSFEEMIDLLGDGIKETWRGNVLGYFWWQRR